MEAILRKLAIELLKTLITKEIMDSARTEIVTYLRDLAKRTDNDLDDDIVAQIAKALEVK